VILVRCFQPENDQWKAWHENAIARLEKLRELADERQPTTTKDKDGVESDLVKIDEKFYKARKTEIFGRFGNRCAYCETLIKDLNQPGDVEHYRPKLAVETLVAPALGAEAKMTLVRQAEHGEETMVRKVVDVEFRDKTRGPHPGYYWLAYQWKNLLPACQTCNKAHYNENSHWVGKGMAFPVEGGANSLDPSALDAESPLLINPNQDDPSVHIELERTGVLIPRRLPDGELSMKGSTTIALLDLNRPELVAERKRAYNHFLNTLGKLFNRTLEDPASIASLAEDQEEFNNYSSGRLPYMLALSEAHRDFRSRAIRAFRQYGLMEDLHSGPDGHPGAVADRTGRAGEAGSHVAAATIGAGVAPAGGAPAAAAR
jgi:hypothetical protein